MRDAPHQWTWQTPEWRAERDRQREWRPRRAVLAQRLRESVALHWRDNLARATARALIVLIPIWISVHSGLVPIIPL